MSITSVGTPFQLYFPDASKTFYKRQKSSGVWSEWYSYSSNDTYLVRSRLSKSVSVANSAVSISFSETRSGYTPVMFSELIHNNSTTITCGIEGASYANGSFSASGYAKRTDGGTSAFSMNFYIDVLWRRN